MGITPTTSTFFIQFGSFEPINVEIYSTPKVTSNVLKDNSGTGIKFHHKEPLIVDGEGWTFVTRRRNRKETSLTQSREAPKRFRIVKKPTKMNESKGTETATLPLTDISTQFAIACYLTRFHAGAIPRGYIYIYAKFYLEDDTLEGIQAITPPSTREVKLQSEIPKPDFSAEVEEEAKQNENSKGKTKQQGFEAIKLSLVVRYVPIAERKEGQSPFFGDEESILKSLQEVTLHVAKITKTTLSCQTLRGFARPSQAPTIKHGSFPTKRTDEGFDPNAYKLMAKASYNHKEPNGLGKLIPEASGEKDCD
ncbi:hypothetical protein FCV25MIE_27559 [Fagus crenata]